MTTIRILRQGQELASASGERAASLLYRGTYQPGDEIRFEAGYSRARVTVDQAVAPARVFIENGGFTYRVPRTRVQICTLPIGYADGLSRTLSNRMDVLYQGERIRQVGNICMDQCMAAISETSMGRMPEANYGDVMTIIGRDGDAEITMDEMARLRGTINYEVACGFGMRLDKVYV